MRSSTLRERPALRVLLQGGAQEEGGGTGTGGEHRAGSRKLLVGQVRRNLFYLSILERHLLFMMMTA